MALLQNQLQPFFLAGSGVVVGATTITLKSMLTIDGAALTMATDFGDIAYGTIDAGNSTLEEQISFTGLTNNSNGTTTLTGVKTVLFDSPYTETSGLAKTHAGSAPFVISNTSGFYNAFAKKASSETITGTWTFDAFPVTPSTPLATTSVAGFTEIATQAEVVAKTATGGTGASLTVTPALMPSVLLSDYKADTGSANAYAIAPSPAITSYTAGQTFTFKATNANTGASTLNVNSLGTKTIKLPNGNDLGPNNIVANQVVQVEYDGTNFQMTSFVGNISMKFGGDGSDGPLSITSGTTTIDLANAQIVVKNYSSISITGTGSLAFINPNTNGTVIYIKSLGNVTLTSSATPMIDASGMGATGGASVTTSSNEALPGVVGVSGTSFLWKSNGGGAGAATSGGTSNGGAGGALVSTVVYGALARSKYAAKYLMGIMGAGGGSGGVNNIAGTTTSTIGGSGGGFLIIECGEAWNFTTANGISVAGKQPATGSVSSNGASAGSGGGAGGTFIGLYKSLTSNSGTVNVSGGAAGSGTSIGSITGRGASGGGGGGSYQAGTSAANASNGTVGSGGAGADGYSIVSDNAEFA